MFSGGKTVLVAAGLASLATASAAPQTCFASPANFRIGSGLPLKTTSPCSIRGSQSGVLQLSARASLTDDDLRRAQEEARRAVEKVAQEARAMGIDLASLGFGSQAPVASSGGNTNRGGLTDAQLREAQEEARRAVELVTGGASKMAQLSSPAPSSVSSPRAGGGESVADILARAAAMTSRSGSTGSAPAAPVTKTASAGGGESIADILARAAAMERGGVSPNKGSPAFSAANRQSSAPAPALNNESVADILARAAAMSNRPK